MVQPVRRPAVDLDSVGEPYLAALRQAYRDLGRELWVLDLTSDLGIPAFASLSRRTDGAPEQICFGFGAHLDARLGVLRAVTEMNQFLPFASADPEQTEDVLAGRDVMEAWLSTETVERQPWLLPAEAPPRTASSYGRLWTDDVRDDVLRCQAIVEARGHELLVLDQTRPDIGLPVAKVLVPGLRHFWARFAPGRLYEVPVALGWLAAPLAEEALNPIPMFW